uniref:Uncharacterized protein n=1 Tax=Tanacetum cinerariifolium TaxID=118510 RepID=A0A6L2M428_TANCI|nr:hypothetical protein [Tanacetum cinerariifolium]
MLVHLPLPLSPLLLIVPSTWFATSLESMLTWTLRTPICATIRRLAISTSYSASLLEAVNWNLSAYVNSFLSGLVSINPAPDPSTHDDPSMNSVYGSYGVSIIGVSGEASSDSSMRKSARIWPFTNVRGRSVMGCTWKYLRNLWLRRLAPGLAFSLGYSLAWEPAAPDSQNRPVSRHCSSRSSKTYQSLRRKRISFEEWQRFFRRFEDESVQASQLSVEALDFFDCSWGWEL